MKCSNLNFVRIIQTSVLLLVLSACANNVEDKSANDHVLWYRQPAQSWLEALPVGNGKLGAMVHGSPETEKLQLNEETLWAGCPEDPVPANAKKHYAKFQQLNLSGKFDEALDYAMENLAVEPTSFRSYQTLGDLFISFEKHKDVESYKRELNLQKGISKIEYTIDGKRFVRESFVSAKYNTIFYHFKSLDKEPVTSRIYFEREKDIKDQYIKGNTLVVDGQIFDDPNARDDNRGGSGKGGHHMKFAAQILLKSNSGEQVSSSNELIIKDSQEFTVMFTAASDYNLEIMNFDREINPMTLCEQAIETVAELDYEAIKAEHIARHSAIMNRVQFDITPENTDTIPTDVRLASLKDKKTDKYLTELLFQYGRYLLLSSSEENSVLPANLQGIWNDRMWAAWESDFHLNINLQMNYWPADVCNLSETMQPLANFMEKLSEKGSLTASEFLDTEGWMVHHCTNAFGRTTPSGSSKFSQVNNGYCFPLAGAWMAITLWRHYEFVQNEAFLKNTAYPILSGAARFILDFLVENEKGELVTVPSYSPENKYIDPESGKTLRNTVAASIDIQIIRDVFNACLKAEKILNKETELSTSISEAIQKLPEIKIGANGTIQEWYEDYEEAEVGHRHISHLYALYPSNQINQNTPELYEAAKKTLDRRLSNGGGQTGWSRAWMISFYARLQNGDACYKHVTKLLEEQMTPNLFDLHPPRIFQIDGNLGATAGIAEMLVQSQEEGIVSVLPALPSQWKEGFVTGLKARGGLELDINWSNNELDKVVIRSDSEQKFKLRYRGNEIPVNMAKDDRYVYDAHLN